MSDRSLGPISTAANRSSKDNLVYLWGYVSRSAGTPSLSSPSFNITSVADNGDAKTTITIGTDFSSAVYAPGAQAVSTGVNQMACTVSAMAAGVFDVFVWKSDTSTQDTTDFSFWAFGRQ